MEYYIRREPETGDPLPSFKVTKFDQGSDAPLERYTVQLGQKLSKCDCMAWSTGRTRPCKHVAMVKEFISAGEPQPYCKRS